MSQSDVLLDLSLAGLMRVARNAYASALQGPLAESEFDDIPRDGIFAISVIAAASVSAAELGRWLGVSKQAVSQLLDTLVLRRYIARTTDIDDRRRIQLALTERGREVFAVCRRTIAQVDRKVADAVGRERLQHTRETLHAIIKLAFAKSDAGEETRR